MKTEVLADVELVATADIADDVAGFEKIVVVAIAAVDCVKLLRCLVILESMDLNGPIH